MRDQPFGAGAAAVRREAIRRGTVVGRAADGALRVSVGSGDAALVCDVLRSGQTPAAVEGDDVLVWSDEGDVGARGVILGVIERGSPPDDAVDDAADEPPDTLVIEARHSLTFRCGDGSITLRADGRIQIKGKDLVSHAQRLNRIKGGAVSIN